MTDIHVRPTEMTVSGGALLHNARLLAMRLRPGVRMMAVVKADAYGHGAADAARVALDGGARALAVALVEEGIALRDAGIGAPILVLGGVTPEGAKAAVARDIALALYTEETLFAMQAAADRYGVTAKAHIKIDTGMARVGLRGDAELLTLLSKMDRCPNVACEGAFTHFAAAGDDPDFTALQARRFDCALALIRRTGRRPVAHAAASEAFLLGDALQYDMVRPGIALYGAAVNALCKGLVPAQRVTTYPVRVETVAAGESVGYGRTAVLARDSRIATLPIGYGDGYPRALSNRACALVRGRRAPIVGRVCMDMLMIDVTDIPGAGMGDECVLLGEQGNDRITPDELADLAGTIPYEIMLGFSPRVPRRFIPITTGENHE